MRHYENWLDAFIKHNEPNKFPKKFLKWAGISVIAGALERKTWILYKGAQVYPNLFIMLVGPPGSGKSKSASEAVKYLSHVPNIHFTPNIMTQASLIKDLEDAGLKKEFNFKNTVYRMSAVYIHAGEATNTLGENYGSVIKILTDLYDCGYNGWHRDRHWHKATKTSGDERIFNPCINMLACTTIEWLTDFIDIKDLRGGFSSRNIFVYEPSYNTDLVTWQDDDDEINVGFNKNLGLDLQDINKLKGKFSVSAEVKEKAPLIEQNISKELDIDRGNKFNHFKVRKFWNILKISQVLSAAESSRMVIEWRHFNEAHQMLNEFMEDLPELFNNIGRNREAPVLAEMRKWIKDHDWFTQAQFMQEFQTEMRPKDIMDFWRNLVQMNMLVYKVENKLTKYKFNAEMKDHS